MSWIKTQDIRNGVITAAKLAAGATGTAALADLSVTTGKIAANAVSHAKLDVQVEQVAIVTITNAEMLALRAAPKTLVAAPGAGKALVFERGVFAVLSAGGAYTETADNMEVKYTNGSGTAASTLIESTGFIDQTTQQYRSVNPKADALTANALLCLHNSGDGEFGGGDAGAVITFRCYYRIVTL